jgi:hypothetical protein
VIAAAYDNWVGLALGVALVVLMAVVLIVPERF